MVIKTKTLLFYLLLTVLCAVLYLPGITKLPMLDRDSSHFAQATKQMLETHNYWQVNFQNEARHLKPPGIYWLEALAVKATHADPNTVWPYRLPNILGAWFSVLALFYFARKFFTEKIALFSAIFLATSFLLVFEAHLIVTDTVLLFTMILMQCSLWQVYIKEDNKFPWLFWIAMAAGILIKGMTLVIALLTLIGIAIVDRNLNLLKKTKPIYGVILVLLLTLAWLIPLSISSHSNFFMDMIRGDLLPKIEGGQQSHGLPPGFFTIIFPITFWPISLFFWHGGYVAIQERKQALIKFLLTWIVSIWIFFEIIPTKLPEYVLPAYPAIAMLIAYGLEKFSWEKLSKPWKIWITTYSIIWWLYSIGFAAIMITISYLLSEGFVSLGIALGIITIIASILSLIFLIKDRLQISAVILIIAAISIYAGIFQWFLPARSDLWISNHIVNNLNQNDVTKEKPLLAIGYGEPSLVFLLGTDKVLFSNYEVAADQLKSHDKQYVLIDEKNLDNFLKFCEDNHIQLETITTVKGYDYSSGKWVKIYIYRNM